MRISDWSSDVCSSDLRRQGRGQSARGDGGDGRQARRHEGNGGLPARSQSRQGAGHGAEAGAAAAAAGTTRSTEATQTAEGRSEEHTSELQSLMRISYAVFCLKTNKHQTPQPNTPYTPTNT